VNLVVYCLLIPIGLWGPGWLLNRALGTDAGPTGAFLGSAAILVNLVLALDAIGQALNRANTAIGLAAISAVLWLIGKLQSANRPSESSKSPRIIHVTVRASLFWLIATVIGLAGATIKVISEPLSGYDTIFRWDFLARQMWQQAGLNFYPPVKAADFLVLVRV
jgi:hypothetical protein